MPPPAQQDKTIALVHHAFDGDQLQEQEWESGSEDENVDSQFLTQPEPQVTMTPASGTSLVTK